MSQADRDLERVRTRALLKGALRLGETDDFGAGLRACITALCEASGWLYGQAWVTGEDPTYLMLSPAWHAVPGDFSAFRRSFEKQAFQHEGGLAMEAHTTGLPTSRLQLGEEAATVSVGVDGSVRLTSVIYLPLVAGDRCLGVLEFYTADHSDVDVLTRLMAAAAGQFADALAQKREHQSERAVAERFRDLVEGVADYAIFMLDTEGMVTSWNAGAERMMGYQPSEIIGRDFSVFYPQESLPKDPTEDLKRAASDGRLEHEGWRVRKDGSRFIAHVLLTPMFDGAGQVRGYSQVIRDITERRLAEDRLEHLALHDDLTGLANRTLFVDRLGQALARIGRTARFLAVMFFDLDDFKKINDTLGHDAGDELLKAVADRLRGAIRPQDTIARFGGDEFVVLCEDLAGIEEVTTIAERIIGQIAVPVPVAGRELPLSLSMGIALAKDPDQSRLGLLQDADSAMYRAKSRGRGGFEFFDEAMREQARQRRDIERDIQRAFSEKEMCLHHQPVVDLATGLAAGFEGLIRWNHPQRGVIAPSEFYELAEDAGLAIMMAEWVFEDACRWLASHGRDFPTRGDPFVSVNMTERQLRHPDLAGVATGVLRRYGLSPSQLVIEVRGNVSDSLQTDRIVQKLRSAGLLVALDGYGSAGVSAPGLTALPVDIVKITGELIEPLGKEGGSSRLTSAVVELVHSLGQKVIAHGVERKEQLDILRRLGCDMVQGHLLGVPRASR